MIRVEGLTRRFGGVLAVDGVTFAVPSGGATGVIGPNGAGKSTLMALLGGQLRPDAGRILLDGVRIDGRPAHRVHRLGLVRTFQTPRPFRRLTVLENLLLVRPEVARAREILAELRLDGHAGAPAGQLSGGQLKLLDLGRALMATPSALVLDEPCAGVNPALLDFLSVILDRLRARGMTLLIVEHDLGFVARHCDDVLVMAGGRVLTQGKPDAVRADPRVLEAFLGG